MEYSCAWWLLHCIRIIFLLPFPETSSRSNKVCFILHNDSGEYRHLISRFEFLKKKRNMLKTNIVWHVHNGSGLCRLRRRVCSILRSHGMQVYVWFKFSFLSTLFNIQLVAAVPGGCNSQLQENVESQHGLTCSQWQWIVHIEASSLLHFAFTWHARMFDSSFRFCQRVCSYAFLWNFPILMICWFFGFLKLGDLSLC